MALVYLHTNKLTNQKYVGITKRAADTRWKEGLGYETQYFGKAGVQVFGWDGFHHDILIDGISAEMAATIEGILIRRLETDNPKYGYNDSRGTIIQDLVPEAEEHITNILKDFPTLFNRTELNSDGVETLKVAPQQRAVVMRSIISGNFKHSLSIGVAKEIFDSFDFNFSNCYLFTNDIYLAFGKHFIGIYHKGQFYEFDITDINDVKESTITLLKESDRSQPTLMITFAKKYKEQEVDFYRWVDSEIKRREQIKAREAEIARKKAQKKAQEAEIARKKAQKKAQEAEIARKKAQKKAQEIKLENIKDETFKLLKELESITKAEEEKYIDYISKFDKHLGFLFSKEPVENSIKVYSILFLLTQWFAIPLAILLVVFLLAFVLAIPVVIFDLPESLLVGPAIVLLLVGIFLFVDSILFFIKAPKSFYIPRKRQMTDKEISLSNKIEELKNLSQTIAKEE